MTRSQCSQLSKSPVASLSCNFTGRPKVNISWEYPSGIKGIRSSMDSGSSGLITTVGIFNITSVPIDNSSYKIRCVGENPYGKIEQSTTLDIYCKCKLVCMLSFLKYFFRFRLGRS